MPELELHPKRSSRAIPSQTRFSACRKSERWSFQLVRKSEGWPFQLIDATAQKYICTSCGFIYDPAEGDPDGGLAPGTPFEEIPDDWFCPVCGARKKDFELLEE
jgi:rubredoxin